MKSGPKGGILRALLAEARPEQYFFLCDGKVVKNVLELSRELEVMNDGVFQYHVNDCKNDFSSWIRDVFHDTDLANQLLTTADRDKTQIIILKSLIRKFQ